jgi:hypothetical protein
MLTTGQQLVDIICKALIEAEVANEKEVTSLKSRIVAGKVKAEDWNLAIENSFLQAAGVPTNGN